MNISQVTMMAFALVLMDLSRGCSEHQISLQPERGPTCEAFLTLSKPARDIYESWVIGFVSGAGRERAQSGRPPLAPMMLDEIKGWLAAYCTDHAPSNLPQAAEALVDELKQGRPAGRRGQTERFGFMGEATLAQTASTKAR